ncbi:phage tail protein [Amycolatopsis sp. NPDC051071]|uniref:phage tail protein n=1 Tax=Amycolatopsis sp. NPDC051071 TaxID=3154637 RepID=UPI00343EEAC8
MSPPDTPLALGMAMRFEVEAAGLNLGLWSSCKGLEVKTKLHKAYNPGNYSYERILFADINYATVKLERAMEKSASDSVRKWLELWWRPWAQPGTNPLGEMIEFGTPMTIRLLDSQWNEVSSWTLRNAYPSAWAGPSLAATDSKVAIERLEIDHEGFLDLTGIPGL